MTRLFLRFYLGVLLVLFLAWYIHGAVWKQRAKADRARVFEEAHGGGVRLVARELDAVSPENRTNMFETLREQFNYPVNIIALAELPSAVQRQISSGDRVVYYIAERGETVVAPLSNGSEVVRLGPFPDYWRKGVEEGLGGWMRLTAAKLDRMTHDERELALSQLQDQFDFPISIVDLEELPAWPRGRIAEGADVVLYPPGEQPNTRWSAATPLSDGTEVVCFGPLPGFERIEQKAATTTLALVLLPAAIAIALLLRPVAQQLRHVENAARAIAAGDLSARVDERRVRSAKQLALAFNNMASRTETLVRTQRELLQAVSHELRTPLSRMKFAIELIGTAKDDTQRRQRLESLDAATEELDELVGELLNYVRMETAEPRLNREQIELKDTLDILIPKHAALYPSIQFDVHNDVGEQNSILADRTAFQRLLGNLLSNAARSAKSRVKIGMESTATTTTLDVDDDGSGIPEPDRERVFEPFVRLEDGTNGCGAGLGLALVKRIMTQHGGGVDVLTSPLGGCRIRTTWPRGEAVQRQTAN
jgi:two-component system sensor histidine kinase RstB